MSKQKRPNLAKKLICTLIATTFATQIWATELTASVNTKKVGLNEQFQLVLSSDEMFGDSPDLSPLQKDFVVLGTSQSSQIQVINGSTTQSKKWIITLSPKKIGKINIPAIHSGTTASQPIAMEVVKGETISATHQGKMLITASIDKTTYYQFQEIPLTVHIETSLPLQQAELIAPTSADFELSQTGDDRVTQMVKDGQPISVIERHYFLRPQKTGDLTLPPFVLRGYLQGKRQDPFADFQRQFGGFDNFFNSPFDDMISQGEPFAIKSEPLSVSVQTSAKSQAGEWFLPAKSVQLQAKWQIPNPTFNVGEAVTRKIDLIALGATPEQLPKLTFSNADGVKIYVDSDKTASQETPQGTQALREISVSIVPTQAGKITLPEIQVKWLNTQTNKQEIAVLPAQTITVEGLPNTAPTSALQNVNSQTTTQTKAIKSEPPKIEKIENAQNNDNSLSFIAWGGIIGALLGAGVLSIFLIRRKRQPSTAYSNKADDKKMVTKNNNTHYVENVEKALHSQNEKQLYQALLQWQRSGVNFTDELKQLFQQLEQLCYQLNSKTNMDWQSMNKAIQQQKSLKERDIQKGNKELPPLY
ncbi:MULTISPECIES: BatD family protein [Pasteurellaceae]|uniref:BatD family protein n=1 Tax=Pasteurella atlantica TaxID=2827233 RepID=A0AAW8CM35_9PAST|nr:BatD family protein [Pasteurella atlantica]MBR0572635.1 protein BatD [Pasteurella atlantica]MDP8038581.1 BatD family protein [Pasteurella atlantica]MDP8040673.1 BatD family protein [Pasteurella atlantica]MDP8042808.1 BatD family protein [Pasteurella atlantica]MDP8044895.1 BatD family protein [Pasteurella atlantica]